MLRGIGSKCGNGPSFHALPAVLSLCYEILRESFERSVTVHFAGTLSSLEKINKYCMKELISHFRSNVDSHTHTHTRTHTHTHTHTNENCLHMIYPIVLVLEYTNNFICNKYLLSE